MESKNDVVYNGQGRPGVGSNHTKSLNHFEKKNRMHRRNQKLQWLQQQLQAQQHEEYLQEQDEYFAPVDKHDARHMKKMVKYAQNYGCWTPKSAK